MSAPRHRMLVKSCFRFANTIVPKTRWGDRVFSSANFRVRHGRWPDERISMNDVLHRIKVSDEMLRPERTLTSCKMLVKDFVRARCGEEFVVPTTAWLTSREEIETFFFPRESVVKPSHASGKVQFTDAGIDREKITSWLDLDYYHLRREVNYRYLTRGALVEPVLFGGSPVLDFKVFCHNGRAKAIQVDIDRHGDHRRNLYDRSWVKQTFTIAYPKANFEVPRPRRLEDMIEVAEALARDFNFVRIDFYTDDHALFVGEITHCHGSSWEKPIPSSAEGQLDALLFS